MCCELTKPITDVFDHLTNLNTANQKVLRNFILNDYSNKIGIYPKSYVDVVKDSQLANMILIPIYEYLRNRSCSIDTEWYACRDINPQDSKVAVIQLAYVSVNGLINIYIFHISKMDNFPTLLASILKGECEYSTS